ncbi:MAG: DUF1576 domain-containing protein [Erysipelotrichaceae bacterium]
MFTTRYRPFTILALLTIVLGFVFTPHWETLLGEIFDVVTHHGLLISDLMAIGLGGSFVNTGLIVLLLLAILRFFKSELNGIDIAGLLTVFGFAFFGKTLFTIWPPFIGVLLMAAIEKKRMKDVLPIAMFATAAAPAVAVFINSFSFAGWSSLLIATLIGIGIGMATLHMSGYVKKLHDSLILYNVGFTLGFVLIFVFSLAKAFGLNLSKHDGVILNSVQWELILLLILIFGLLMIYGLWEAHSDEHFSVLKTKETCDYVVRFGYGETLFNVGFLGLFSTLYVLAMGGTINGPVMAGIFTVAGFGAFGKSIRNIWPLMLGVTLTTFVTKGSGALSQVGPIITALFVTGLAPVTKRYGILVAIFFGFAHDIIVANTAILHGYMSLYNNAFAMGLVSMILLPFMSQKHKS